MQITRTETVPIASDEDVAKVRQLVRVVTVELKFSLVEQTKMVTAASELARNVMVHGGGVGTAQLDIVEKDMLKGLRVIFKDEGPGIADIDRALQDGYTTGNGLGLGLSGSKRLVNEFSIKSEPGKGAEITIIRWK